MSDLSRDGWRDEDKVGWMDGGGKTLRLVGWMEGWVVCRRGVGAVGCAVRRYAVVGAVRRTGRVPLARTVAAES